MSNYLTRIPSSSSSYAETDLASPTRSQTKPASTSKKEIRPSIPISSIKPTINISKPRRQAANAITV